MAGRRRAALACPSEGTDDGAADIRSHLGIEHPDNRRGWRDIDAGYDDGDRPADDREPVTANPIRPTFEADRPFPLDPFQVKALDALDAGRSVLVAAPTGSGKTLVAEYAIAKALDGGGKTFYTTPL